MFKTYRIVMLPTDDNTNGMETKNISDIVSFNGMLWYMPIEIYNFKNGDNQHLYILSNEEIEKGDWFVNRQYMIGLGIDEYAVWQYNEAKPNSDPRKIVATTDLSLNLLLIEEHAIREYIKRYNKGNPITEIEMDIENNSTIKTI